jgi:DNA primase
MAREDRACVVEGNTDVIALRQAGFESVVACMGTALTEQQLQELGRLTKRLWLAFDGDAAGESAALRGMELAVRQGFEVNVVALEPGVDPADDASSFEPRLAGSEPYVVYRVRIETERAENREAAFRKAHEILDAYPDGPDKDVAQRLVTDRLGITTAFHSPTPRARAVAAQPRAVDAGTRLERNALAGVLAHPTLRNLLAELTPEHFYDPLHRQVRAHIVDGSPLEGEGLSLLAEIDARADAEGIDAATGEELLWRLRERELRRELQHADPARTKELQGKLTSLLEHVAELTSA